MQGVGSRRSTGAAAIDSRGWRAVVAKTMAGLALCLLAAGCASVGQALGPSPLARDVSIAFESIDGLPRDVSQKLLQDLDQEAMALRIAVVPAGGEASYRIRGYLAAHTQGSGTAIAWAWDVYDGALQRAFRLSGEEQAGAGRGWAAADEALLRRIAHSGMEQLADFMASAPAPAAPAPAPAPGGSAVAGRDDLRPGTAASFRGETAALEPVTVPLPHPRPVVASTTRLADATFGR
ncbi:MAG TPA: hypothetical protein VGN55_04415 [Xanthobacteraceae bacterium]|jgi:hypothetical protein